MVLKPEPDFEYVYPIIDCPICGEINVPVSQLHLINDGLPKTINYCLKCHQVIEELKPKGYVSMLELEEIGWDSEL